MKNQSIQISMLYCSNSLEKEEIDQLCSGIKDLKIKTISLPCSGKVNLLYLLKAIETGSDGLIIATCKFGECKYLQGNFRARKRIDYVDELLAETGFGSGHVKFVSIEGTGKIEALSSEINNLAYTIRFELNDVTK